MNALAELPDLAHLSNSAIASEQSLIGTCLSHAGAFGVACSLVEAQQFYESIHARVWEAMLSLVAAGRPVNVVTIVGAMGNVQVDRGLVLSAYLAKCCAETACPPAYVADYAKQVREAWALRELIADSDDVRSQSALPGADPRTIIGDILQRMDETRVRLDPRRSGFRSIEAVTTTVVDRMACQMQGDVTDACLTTGLKDLDNILGGGLRRGELTIIAGRPGMGKTSAAVSIARQSAKAGHATGFFSLEMMSEQIGARFIADQAYDNRRPLPAGRILHGADLSDTDALRVIEAARAIQGLPLHIDDSSSMTVGEISARARSLATRFEREGRKLELLIIDYLKFVRASERYRGQRHYEVGEISAGLKSLAKDLGCAVVLLAQINRQVESREDKRPQMSDLRESGDLEADADVILFLYREIYYLQQREPQTGSHEYGEWQLACETAVNKLEVIVAKQRIGRVGKEEVFCDVACSALRDMARGARNAE